MIWFEQIISPTEDDTVLDIGGYPDTWLHRPQLSKRVHCINIHEGPWMMKKNDSHTVTVGIGDGCDLSYGDKSYEIVFSNSVIEHVGDWEKQMAFASESARVGSRIWIQTPAFECPLEPHYMAPIVHWLPVSIRRKVLRWFTPWGWISKPSQEAVDEAIFYTRLLTRKQMVKLFPTCEIITEKIFGFIPKSHIAYRAYPCPPDT